ncbi:MAG TPA: NAD(P)-dependent oxidoreductase [Longimicrobium sp.]|jgi:nucleoside-diphosphate-sugar epimerase
MAEARVLVTGATGFLGRPLVERLAREYQVTALARSVDEELPAGVERLPADLAEASEAREALAPWRWDAVVNLAGPAPKGIAGFADGAALVGAHVRAAANLRAAIPAGWAGRLVHASGFIVYGIPRRVPVAEDHPRAPLHAYALGKMLAEDVLLAGDGLDRWILRLPGLFSEERREGALYRFIRAARDGEPLAITAPDPLPWDVLHVGDAVDAILLALAAEARDPGPVNVGHGEPVELAAVARWIAERAGTGSEVRLEGPAHPVFAMDITRARTLMGWSPPPLRERLESLRSAFEVPA